MSAPTRALAFVATAAAALVLAAVFLLPGGSPAEREGRSPGAAAGRPSTPEVPPAPDAPAEEAGAAAPGRTHTRPEVARGPAVAVHGRLVVKASGEPVSGALVKLRTWDEAFDHPETISLLGGAAAVAELRREGRFDDALRAVGGWRAAYAGRSREDGGFSIRVPTDFPQFRFEVEADLAYLEEGSEKWYAPGSPEAEAGIALRLEAGGKIEGTIRAVSGLPVAGARVSIDPADRGRDRQVDAESSGRFAAGGLRPGRYGISALGGGCAPAWREKVEVRAGEITSVDLDLPAEGFVSGRAVDEEGRGIARARIDAKAQESVGPNPHGLGYGRGYADAEGNFRVGSLRSGKHTVTASRPGRVAAKGEAVDVPAGSGVADLKLVLPGGRSVAGRVLDGAGAPVAAAEVTARTDRAAQRSRGLTRSRTWSAQSTVTATDGSFRLGGLDDGPFVVVASSKERGRTERKEIPPGEESLELVLEPTTTIAGRIRDAETGEPVLRFDIELERRDPSRGATYREGQGRKTFATKDGSFEWADRRPGTYRLFVVAKGYLAGEQDGIEAEAGQRTGSVEMALRPGALIRGRVLDGSTGAPVEDVAVSAEPVEVEEATDRSRGPAPGEPTGPDGAFETSGLLAGKWRLRAWREGFVSARTDPIQVAERGTIDGIVIVLPRGGSIEGVATAPDGAPYTGGRAWASRVERSEEEDEIRSISGFGYMGRGSGRGEEIDASGAFRLEGLEPGKYLVQARPASVPGEPQEEIQRKTLRGFVDVEEGSVARVEFARPKAGCLVRGRVARDREGVEGVEVTLVPKEWPKDREARSILEPRLKVRTLPGGAFEIADAPAGEATVGARLSGGTTVAETVTIPAGGELTVELRLPLGEIAGRVVSEVDGSPIPRAAVAAFRLQKEGTEGGSGWSNATAGEDGRYRIRDLSPGAYRVRASPGFPAARDEKAANLSSDERGPVDVGETGPTVVDFSLPVGAKVLVSVRDPDGRPLANASVRLRSEAKPARESGGMRFGPFGWGSGVETGQDGSARFLGIPRGEYFVAVQFDGYAPFTSETRGVAPGEETTFQVEMREGTRLRVRLLRPDGVAERNGWANFTDAKGGEWSAQIPTGEEVPPEGRGLLHVRLAPGTYSVKSGAKGFRSYRGSVVVGSGPTQDFEVRLARGEDSEESSR